MKKIVLTGFVATLTWFLIYPPQISTSKEKSTFAENIVDDSIQNLVDSANEKKEEIMQELQKINTKPIIKYKVKYRERKVIVKNSTGTFEVIPTVDSLGNYVINLD